MAESPDGQEKKHAATDKKRREAAERGQIARSQDLSALAIVAAGGLTLVFAGGLVGQPLLHLGVDLWDLGDGRRLDLDEARRMGALVLTALFQALVLPLGAVALAAVAAGLAQSMGQIAPKALEPKLGKINPLAGFKNLFLSWTPLVELGKGVGKLVLLGAVVGWVLWDRVEELPALSGVHLRAFLHELTELAGLVLFACLPIIAVLAAADYAYSAWKTSQDLKMTDQEYRQHHKDSDGDPLFKGKRRQRQREIAMGTLVQALREADVVITNPTHFAVALRYQRDRDEAPVVVAKGVDHLALHIRRLARDLEVPQVENVPLARALHAEVPVGHPIPEHHYGPVARVLAVLWRRRRSS